VAVAHAIEPRGLASADQITGRLELGRGHVDRLEQPAGVKPRELARIARVGLDALSWPLRHKSRRYHLAFDAALAQMPVETEAGGASLVAAANVRPAAEGSLKRLLVVGQRPLFQKLVSARTAASRIERA
jgi:hypothetical protein